MEIFKEFTIEAAHHLPNVPVGHKCGRLQWSTAFELRCMSADQVDPTMGWVIDFADIKAAFKKIEEAIDHRYLNEVAGLENPTSEKPRPKVDLGPGITCFAAPFRKS